MRRSSILLQIIIGVSIIIFIFKRFDINNVISILKQTDYLFFILACLAYLFLNLVLAARLNYLLTRIGYRIKFSTVFFSHMGGMMAGDITPGRSGYFITPPLMKKNAGSQITDGMACIFAPQGIEFLLKVSGAAAAIIYISTLPGISNDLLISAGTGATILLIVGVLMLTVSWRNEEVTSRLLSRVPFFKNFTDNLLSFKEKNIGIRENINAILILSMVGWVFAALQWFYLGRAIGIELSFFVFFLLHPLLSILMFVPISPAGFGVMELGTIGVFSLFGISPALAVAFSVLVRISILLVDLTGLKTVLASLGDIKF